MENPDYDMIEKEMRSVFDNAIVTAQLACDKTGNTDKPWEDFSIEWLQKRLDDELKEYGKSKKNWKELIDVINIACFLYIAHFNDWIKRSVKNLEEKVI